MKRGKGEKEQRGVQAFRRRVAKCCVRALFVNGAVSLRMVLPDGRAGGAWCESAVIDAIEEQLMSAI